MSAYSRRLPRLPDGYTEGEAATSREAQLLERIEQLEADNRRLRQDVPAEAKVRALPIAQPPMQPVSSESTSHFNPVDDAAYRELFSAMSAVFPIGVFRVNRRCAITHVDDSLCQIFGLNAEDFHDWAWQEQVHPADIDRIRSVWSPDAEPLQDRLEVEFRMRKAGGETAHLLARTIPTRDETGDLIGHLGFVQDLSRLRTLEHDARIKEELNRQIIANSPDATQVIDLQGHVLEITAQACHLMGLQDPEAIRHSDWRQWWDEDGQRLARNAVEQGALGVTSRFVARCDRCERQQGWWDTVVSPITDAIGTVQMLLVVSRDITEQHRQEQEIQRLNTRLETRVSERTKALHQALQEREALYNQAPCGYHSIDATGLIVSANETALQWLGRSREEVVGKKYSFDFVPPAMRETTKRRLQKLIDGNEVEPFEYKITRKDGSPFWIHMSTSAVFDEAGQFIQSNSTMVDITQRKLAEKALLEHQRFLRTITDHVPGLLSYFDTDQRVKFANAEYERMFSLTPEEMLGKPIGELMPHDVWLSVKPHLEAALQGREQRFEQWRTRPDGKRIYVSARYLPDMEDGEIRGVYAQVLDITAQKEVEQRVANLNEELEQRIQDRSAELLASEQRFRLMVDNLRDYAVYFLDTEGQIYDWTDSAQRMMGYTAVDVLGRHVRMLFPEDDMEEGQPTPEQMLRHAAARGQHEAQGWHARKDGSRYWAQSVLIALRSDDGELQGFAGISRDMSDSKRISELMYNLNVELENRVNERTEQLQEANKDLESFSYSVSHDLRSPLRHISSFVSLLEEHLSSRMDDTTEKYLSTIAGSSRHMSQLIDGLLAFSRMGRAALNAAPVEFDMLVEAVVAQVGHETGNRKVEWVIAKDLPIVPCDAILMREVWTNLLGNAYKYSRKNETARIEVGWRTEGPNGYTFYVRDNGVGFDTKYADKLFGVFQRLHRASDFEGTGIGLALTKRIVQRHGGQIWAESRVGEGSTFYFSMPFHTPEGSDMAPPSNLAPMDK
ncbi:PAS domain S-box protein [Hydrogenophaga sp. 5NK40-0174]|uniref:PAS domain-containing sensor histidine kinase n=1 Tax=Hydrogenophaga sp. 5NK40-0174 TaxID=3127649 RepID=UPI0031045DAD